MHDDFCHGFGRLQATYDRYHFSYVDAIDDATTLPMERLALGEGRQQGGRANRVWIPDGRLLAVVSDASAFSGLAVSIVRSRGCPYPRGFSAPFPALRL